MLVSRAWCDISSSPDEDVGTVPKGKLDTKKPVPKLGAEKGRDKTLKLLYKNGGGGGSRTTFYHNKFSNL